MKIQRAILGNCSLPPSEVRATIEGMSETNNYTTLCAEKLEDMVVEISRVAFVAACKIIEKNNAEELKEQQLNEETRKAALETGAVTEITEALQKRTEQEPKAS